MAQRRERSRPASVVPVRLTLSARERRHAADRAKAASVIPCRPDPATARAARPAQARDPPSSPTVARPVQWHLQEGRVRGNRRSRWDARPALAAAPDRAAGATPVGASGRRAGSDRAGLERGQHLRGRSPDRRSAVEARAALDPPAQERRVGRRQRPMPARRHRVVVPGGSHTRRTISLRGARPGVRPAPPLPPARMSSGVSRRSPPRPWLRRGRRRSGDGGSAGRASRKPGLAAGGGGRGFGALRTAPAARDSGAGRELGQVALAVRQCRAQVARGEERRHRPGDERAARAQRPRAPVRMTSATRPRRSARRPRRRYPVRWRVVRRAGIAAARAEQIARARGRDAAAAPSDSSGGTARPASGPPPARCAAAAPAAQRRPPRSGRDRKVDQERMKAADERQSSVKRAGPSRRGRARPSAGSAGPGA